MKKSVTKPDFTNYQSPIYPLGLRLSLMIATEVPLDRKWREKRHFVRSGAFGFVTHAFFPCVRDFTLEWSKRNYYPFTRSTRKSDYSYAPTHSRNFTAKQAKKKVSKRKSEGSALLKIPRSSADRFRREIQFPDWDFFEELSRQDRESEEPRTWVRPLHFY